MLGGLEVSPLEAGRGNLAICRTEIIQNTRPTPNIPSNKTTERILH